MLYSIDSQRYVTNIPHKADYKRWRKNISDEDYNKVVDVLLTEHFGAGEIKVSSFLPGHDWSGTPYEAIWYACNQNDFQAALFFGLIVFKTLMDMPWEDGVWSFGKAANYTERFENIRGMLYFKLDNPPPKP